MDRLERRAAAAPSSSPFSTRRAAQLVDDRHVLDPDRADLDAGHALHARPERLRLDGAEQICACSGELGGRCRAPRGSPSSPRPPRAGRGPGRAARAGSPVAVAGTGLVALAALRAGVEVEQVLAGGVDERRSRRPPAFAPAGIGARRLPARSSMAATPAGPASMCTAFVNGIAATTDERDDAVHPPVDGSARPQRRRPSKPTARNALPDRASRPATTPRTTGLSAAIRSDSSRKPVSARKKS